MDEEELEDIQIDPNLRCNICGESDFALRAGFFYCRECGTKQDQVREIEVDREVEFTDAKHMKILTVKKAKTETPNLTSWECYNYILRGLVDELIQLGAKEELKLVTLQLWAAYLRRMEVAFFNRKHTELPKLGARFHKRDANILYNHAEIKNRKRKRTDDSSKASGDGSRDWRKSKRKLDESLYSATTSETKSSRFSSSTGTTSHAIQIKFSSHARKILKKRMPVNHIKKHENDGEHNLKCHSFPPKKTTLTRHETHMSRTSIQEMYTILAIALNLVEDEIQLTDLLRFISEGHIGTKNVLQYFPENVVMHGKEILNDINFYRHNEKRSYRSLREGIQFMAKFIGLREYRTPNLISLATRYISELNLPPELSSYIERIMNMLPPQMKMPFTKMYPPYEARAMAYIIFVLKLLFGLDGCKEKLISNASKEINSKIPSFSESNAGQHSKLFVWDEWVEYIEMRKVIISQHNFTYGQNYNMHQTMSQRLDELEAFLSSKAQRECFISDAPREISVTTETAVNNMHHVMERTMSNLSTLDDNNSEAITFQASFMPSDSYFKRIRLYASNASNVGKKSNIKIPDFMNEDHSSRTVEPYLNPKTLRDFLRGNNKQLLYERLPCTDNKKYVGIFVSGRDFGPRSLREKKVYEADFRITEKKWKENIPEKPYPQEVIFKSELDTYEKQYMKKLESMAKKREQCQSENTREELTSDQRIVKSEEGFVNVDTLSLHSIDIFNENNMEPNQLLHLTEPRRNLDTINLFKDVEFEGIDDNNAMSKTEFVGLDDVLTLKASEMDYWCLLGHISELTDVKKKNLENLFPRSFLWLLDTCARMINVEWGLIYDQLMAIEIIFAYGVQPLDNFKDCVRLKYLHQIKDINSLVNFYRNIW